MKAERRRTMHVGASPTIFYRANKLRKNLTKAEEILWRYIRNRQLENVKFRRQHPIGDFIPDFYAHEIKLAIEVDGEYHQDKFQKFCDEQKDNTLNSFGVTVLRYTNEEVITNLQSVLEDIKENIWRLRNLKASRRF